MHDQLIEILLQKKLIKQEDLESFEIKMSENELDIEHIISIYQIRLNLAKDNKRIDFAKMLQNLLDDLQKGKFENEDKLRVGSFSNKNIHLVLFVNPMFTKVLGYIRIK